tara:strand:+ start:774 stop:1055 length:282 start_codon:yes stop_codon:yes gene_type:complete
LTISIIEPVNRLCLIDQFISKLPELIQFPRIKFVSPFVLNKIKLIREKIEAKDNKEHDTKLNRFDLKKSLKNTQIKKLINGRNIERKNNYLSF